MIEIKDLNPDFLKVILDKIKRHESWRSKPYHCSADKLTIGYGTNIEKISREEGELLLRFRLNEIYKYALPQLPEYAELTSARKFVYLDMLYNLGFKRFKSFKRMRKAVQEGNWHGAANEIVNSKYYRQVGLRAMENEEMMRFGR